MWRGERGPQRLAAVVALGCPGAAAMGGRKPGGRGPLGGPPPGGGSGRRAPRWRLMRRSGSGASGGAACATWSPEAARDGRKRVVLCGVVRRVDGREVDLVVEAGRVGRGRALAVVSGMHHVGCPKLLMPSRHGGCCRRRSCGDTGGVGIARAAAQGTARRAESAHVLLLVLLLLRWWPRRRCLRSCCCGGAEGVQGDRQRQPRAAACPSARRLPGRHFSGGVRYVDGAVVEPALDILPFRGCVGAADKLGAAEAAGRRRCRGYCCCCC